MGNNTAIKVARAFVNGQRMSSGNYQSTGTQFLLFGNVIAEWSELHYLNINLKDDKGFWIRDCGWCSATTAQAINALPGVRLRRIKGEWIWNEKEKWNGKEKFISYQK